MIAISSAKGRKWLISAVPPLIGTGVPSFLGGSVWAAAFAAGWREAPVFILPPQAFTAPASLYRHMLKTRSSPSDILFMHIPNVS